MDTLGYTAEMANANVNKFIITKCCEYLVELSDKDVNFREKPLEHMCCMHCLLYRDDAEDDDVGEEHNRGDDDGGDSEGGDGGGEDGADGEEGDGGDGEGGDGGDNEGDGGDDEDSDDKGDDDKDDDGNDDGKDDDEEDKQEDGTEADKEKNDTVGTENDDKDDNDEEISIRLVDVDDCDYVLVIQDREADSKDNENNNGKDDEENNGADNKVEVVENRTTIKIIQGEVVDGVERLPINNNPSTNENM